MKDQEEDKLKNYYPSTFLTESVVTQKVLQSSTISPDEIVSPQPTDNFNPAQQDYIDLFRLEKESIDNISMNSFLQDPNHTPTLA